MKWNKDCLPGKKKVDDKQRFRKCDIKKEIRENIKQEVIIKLLKHFWKVENKVEKNLIFFRKKKNAK